MVTILTGSRCCRDLCSMCSRRRTVPGTLLTWSWRGSTAQLPACSCYLRHCLTILSSQSTWTCSLVIVNRRPLYVGVSGAPLTSTGFAITCMRQSISLVNEPVWSNATTRHYSHCSTNTPCRETKRAHQRAMVRPTVTLWQSSHATSRACLPTRQVPDKSSSLEASVQITSLHTATTGRRRLLTAQMIQRLYGPSWTYHLRPPNSLHPATDFADFLQSKVGKIRAETANAPSPVN